MNITIITNITLDPFFSESLRRYWPNYNIFFIRPEVFITDNKSCGENEFIVIWLDFETLLTDKLRELLRIIKAGRKTSCLI